MGGKRKDVGRGWVNPLHILYDFDLSSDGLRLVAET